MKLVSLSFVLVLAVAACGGKSKAPTVTGTSGGATTSGVPAAWAEVFVEGASFQLDNSQPDQASDEAPLIVTAHVDKVTKEGDSLRAELRWTDLGGEDVMSNGLPLQIQINAAGIWFWVGGEDIEALFAAPPTYPAGSDKTLRDGYYDVVTRNDDGTVCYGWEPGPDAGDCEDVCFADVCVAPGKGIVSGSGNWWPNAEIFHAVK